MNYEEKIGTKENPMVLKTPPGSSEYTMHVGEKDGQQILVCTVGKTVLHYNIRAIEDLHAMLKSGGPVPAAPFDGLAVLEPAKDYKNRHASIMLAFDATLAAIDDAKVTP